MLIEKRKRTKEVLHWADKGDFYNDIMIGYWDFFIKNQWQDFELFQKVLENYIPWNIKEVEDIDISFAFAKDSVKDLERIMHLCGYEYADSRELVKQINKPTNKTHKYFNKWDVFFESKFFNRSKKLVQINDELYLTQSKEYQNNCYKYNNMENYTFRELVKSGETAIKLVDFDLVFYKCVPCISTTISHSLETYLLSHFRDTRHWNDLKKIFEENNIKYREKKAIKVFEVNLEKNIAKIFIYFFEDWSFLIKKGERYFNNFLDLIAYIRRGNYQMVVEELYALGIYKYPKYIYISGIMIDYHSYLPFLEKKYGNK